MPVHRAGVGSTVSASEVAADVATQAELDAAIAALPPLSGRVGVIAPTPGLWAQANGAITASRATLGRFVPPRSFSATVIAFVVTTAAGADDACDVGIYDTSFARLVSAGATAGKLNSTGVKEITITSTPLTAGTPYYAAFSSGTHGGTSASVARAQYTTSPLAQIFGSGATVAENQYLEAAHPLGATISPTAGGVGVIPLVAVRES